MHHRDLTPLLRATVGFDRMMNMLDASTRPDTASSSYPPYNIEKTAEHDYRITMAVAGFTQEELEITIKENSLHITGKKERDKEDKVTYLHRGIANRSFERSFDLADHIKVTGANLENGLLIIELTREIPEAKKPRNIPISNGVSIEPELIDQK